MIPARQCIIAVNSPGEFSPGLFTASGKCGIFSIVELREEEMSMSRRTVLELLRGGQGAFLSGEELSRRLGLSRAAVWKAVDALRREGYVIEARTGLGGGGGP